MPHGGGGRHRDPGGRLVEHRQDQLPAGASVPGEPGERLRHRHRQDSHRSVPFSVSSSESLKNDRPTPSGSNGIIVLNLRVYISVCIV